MLVTDGKLPPPVPPRPSKALVAEALARTRGVAVPTRKAPPPPVPLARTLLPPPPATDIPRRVLLRNNSDRRVATEKEASDKKPLSEDVNSSRVNNINSVEGPERVPPIVPNPRQVEPLPSGRVQPSPNNRLVKDVSEPTLSEEHIYEEVNRVPDLSQHRLPNGHAQSEVPSALVVEKTTVQVATSQLQNRCEVVKHQQQTKIRRHPYVPVLPTGQHKHDKSAPPPPVRRCATENGHGSPLIEDLVVELRESSRQRVVNEGGKVRIQHSDWFKLEDDGQQVRYSSCQITLDGVAPLSMDPVDFRRRRAMASLQGLPPLPKSLSGLNLFESSGGGGGGGGYRPVSMPAAMPSRSGSSLPPPLVPRTRKPTGLDQQLAILRKEMFGLRQLDLSLLSQLWSLNESIQEFRQLLADQEDSAALSPPSPSSADEAEEFYSPLPRYRAVQLTSVPEQYRLSSSSSQSSIEYGDV